MKKRLDLNVVVPNLNNENHSALIEELTRENFFDKEGYIVYDDENRAEKTKLMKILDKHLLL